jgi:F0F1-type ATP synthase delta subunit
MESDEKMLPKRTIELELNKIIDDISKVLEEHGVPETVAVSVEVKVELTEEQKISIPESAQKKLNTFKPVPFHLCYDPKDGHHHNCP